MENKNEMTVVYKANLPLLNKETVGEFMRALSDSAGKFLIKKLRFDAAKAYCYSEEIYSDKIVLNCYDGIKGYSYYGLAYERDLKTGIFSFSDPVSVRKITTFEEIDQSLVSKAKKEQVSKPYPNEHAARQTDPKQYDSFARVHPKGFPDGVDVIFGIKEVDGKKKSEIQTLRFDSSLFTPDQAKKWLKDHKFKTVIEEAAKKFVGEYEDISKELDLWEGVL
jgi:hypothetical protein